MKEGKGAVGDTVVTVTTDTVRGVVVEEGDVKTINSKVRIVEDGIEGVVAGTAPEVPMKKLITQGKVCYNPSLALLEDSGVLTT